jgi:hypothetical protein
LSIHPIFRQSQLTTELDQANNEIQYLKKLLNQSMPSPDATRQNSWQQSSAAPLPPKSPMMSASASTAQQQTPSSITKAQLVSVETRPLLYFGNESSTSKQQKQAPPQQPIAPPNTKSQFHVFSVAQ